MITIHREKEIDFEKNGYGAIDDYIVNPKVDWEMNGEFHLSFEYPSFLDKAVYLKNKNIIRAPVPFMQDQLFRIYRTRKVLGFIEVEARHIFYDLLDNLIEDTNIVGKNGQGALQQLLGATQYPHRFIGLSDITLINNARMVRYNPVEALLDDAKLNSFVSRWGGEVVRDNFTIRMAKQMGTNRGVHIQHKKDLTGYEATIDESTVVTRIMPTGFDGLRLPELYVDSPLLDADNPKIRVIKYDDVKAAVGEYADDEDAIPLEDAYELLRKYAKEEYSVNHLDEPETVISVSFVTLHNTKEYEEFSSLQEVHQGDVVKVSVPDEGFEITSRLVAFTSDPLQKDHYISTTLGNHVFEFTTSNNESAKIRNELDQIRESITTVLQAANGKNRNFWGTADPNTLNLKADVGDIYYRENGEETTLYRYVEVNGERYWKEIVDTADIEKVKREVEDALAKAEAAQEAVEDAYNDAVTEAERLVDEQSAEFDAKLEDETSTIRDEITTGINDAITNANNYTDGQKQAIDNQINLVEQEMSHVKSTADSAVNSINTAIVNAGFTSLSDSLTGIKSIANQAKMGAQTGITNAATALSQAQSAISQLGGLSGKITSIEQDIDEINGVLSTKVSATEFNSLTGTVTNLSTTQTQQAGLIAQKANQSTVDTLSGRVTTAEGQISTQAGQLALRVTEVQAKNIADSAVDGLEIGGRNYIKSPMSGFSSYNTNPVLSEDGTLTFTKNANGGLIAIRVNDWVPENSLYTVSGIMKRNGVPVKRNEWQHGGINTALTNEGLALYIDDSTGYFEVTQKWGNSSWIFHASYSFLINDEITIEKLMMVKGNKAFDWSPDPENTIQLISSVSAELKIEKDNITSLLTRTGNNETAINQVKNTADGTKQTVANHTGKITTLETNVNGLKISVADKVSNAQFTVLSNSVSSVVSDLDNMSSPGDNLVVNGSFESGTVGWLLNDGTLSGDGHSGDKSLKPNVGQSTKATLRTPITVIPGNTYEISFWCKTSSDANATVNNQKLRLGRMDNSLITDLGWNGARTEWTRMSKVWTAPSDVYAIRITISGNHSVGWVLWDDVSIVDISEKENTKTQITQLSNQIDFAVTNGDVIGRINVQAGLTLISNKKLLLDANTYILGSTFANDIKAKSLEAVEADIANIRTKILTADVITSTHLKVDGAMINKLNVNNLLVNYLVTNSIVTSSMRTNSLSAITANITSIRSQILVSDVVTSTHLKSDIAMIDKLFATTALIDRLTSKQAFINSIKAIEISADRITAGTLNAANVNIINLNANNITTGTLDASKVTVKNLSADSITSGSLRADLISSSFGSQYSIFMGAGYLSISGSLGNKVELNTNSLTFSNPNSDGFEIWSYNDTVRLSVAMNKNFYLYRGFATTSGASAIISVLGADAEINFWRNLNMRSKSITNQSDQTLKTNITATVVKALDLFKSYNFVDFNWIDPMSPQERQFGLIAQRTPFLSEQGEDGIWNINSSKQIMLNSLGIKELDEKITRIDTFINQHDIEIDNLKKENEKLRQRIQTLEEKVA